MNRDGQEGRVKEAKDPAERKPGEPNLNKDLPAESSIDKAAGAVQETHGEATNASKNTTADVRWAWREARKQHRAPRPARPGKR
jgi:hypothetical protein